MADPPHMVMPWKTGMTSRFMVSTSPAHPPVQLLPADVHSMIQLLGDMLEKAPLNQAQRNHLAGSFERLKGIQTTLPPSTGATFAAWVRTLLAPAIDGEHVVRDGNLVLDALMRNGDAVGAQAAQVAMQDLSSKIISALLTPSSAGGNKLDEPGDASGIIWHEPGEKLFYSLDDAHGARLSKLLEDMRNAAMYLKRGSRATTRALFIGQAGNGKTKAALWIAAQLGIPVAYVMLAGARSSYIAKGAKNLLACVKAAKERGAALFFDEVEALSARRDTDSPNVSGEDLNTTAALNQIFDAMPPDMIVFGATNVVKKVDPAIARRFRTHITFGPPNRKTRASIIANQWRLITADAYAREQLIDGTDGKSGALTEELAEEASNAAARLRGVDAVVTIDEVRQALHHARTETYFADGHAAATAESKIITLGGR